MSAHGVAEVAAQRPGEDVVELAKQVGIPAVQARAALDEADERGG
jgi:hypothetical protein